MAERARADQDGPFKAFDFEEWLRDGVEGVRSEFKRTKQNFDISNFRMHIRNAQKEQLLALRSLIDKAIEALEKDEKKNQENRKAA